MGGLNQRFVLPPAGKCIFSFLSPSGTGRAVHRQLPPATEHRSSGRPGRPPRLRLPPVPQAGENPSKGTLQLSLPLPQGCMSPPRQPCSWCGTYPGPHIPFSARADRAGKSLNTPNVCTLGRPQEQKKHFTGTGRSKPPSALLLSSLPTFTGSGCGREGLTFLVP